MAKTTRIVDIERVVHGNKVKTDFIAAPHTQIRNEQGEPRRIPDLANNLKPSFGVERVMVSAIKKLDREFGINGEPVFEADNKDSRVRFVGDWVNSSVAFSGTAPTIETAKNGSNIFLEITFYGTGLNILRGSAAGSIDVRVSVDNGAYTQLYAGVSNVLANRNYNQNLVTSTVSGLSLGFHTVRIYKEDTVGNLFFHGFEVLNESAQLTINSGQPFVGGLAAKLDAQSLLDIKPAALTGTKGGRVLTYLDEEGNIGQAVQAVDPAVTIGNPAELVTNGTFDSDIVGWLDESSGTGFIAWDATNGGSIKLHHGGNFSANRADATTEISLIAGNKYNIKADLVSNSTAGTLGFYLQDTGLTTTYATQSATNGGEKINILFEATITQTYKIRLGTDGSSSAGDIYVDNISVKEAAYNFLALASTNHLNEEIVSKINFREFGKNRDDDFSTLAASASDRAFTLDDGTTTLVGDNAINFETTVGANSGGFLAITFVGTGLDLLIENPTVSAGIIGSVVVDGVTVGDYTRFTGVQKICSGLPYGTHTVKFESASNSTFTESFIIYQPKKPALPENSIELADYNVMADFIANSTAGLGTVSTGVLRKQVVREFVYANGTGGTEDWSIDATVNPTDSISGFNTYSNRLNAYAEYGFFGKGFDIRISANAAHTPSATVSLNGVALTSTNFPTATFSTYGSVSFDSNTGILDTNNSTDTGSGLVVSGLQLGSYTFKINNNNASTRLLLQALDIITPIHINSSDLKTGSLALNDLRADSDSANASKNKVDLSKAKAWIEYDQITNEILNSHNISAVLDISTGVHRVYLKHPFKDANYVVVDGSFGNSKTSTISKERDSLEVRATSGGTVSTRVDVVFSLVFFGELENEEDISLDDL